VLIERSPLARGLKKHRRAAGSDPCSTNSWNNTSSPDRMINGGVLSPPVRLDRASGRMRTSKKIQCCVRFRTQLARSTRCTNWEAAWIVPLEGLFTGGLTRITFRKLRHAQKIAAELGHG